MKIQKIYLHPYEIPLINGQLRKGYLLKLCDQKGREGFGDMAPLPKWSKETLEEALDSLNQKKDVILDVDWTSGNCLNLETAVRDGKLMQDLELESFCNGVGHSQMVKDHPIANDFGSRDCVKLPSPTAVFRLKELKSLNLLPSASFALESALLSLLSPLPKFEIEASALFMGSLQDIFEQAAIGEKEGFKSAKLKVSHLSFNEAYQAIQQLKNTFYLRIDVNRAWKTKDSLHFFSQFSLDAFDYVEEPFENPKDLVKFTHPLAVDESFPHDLTLKELQALPTLKALIYKPTMQGGMLALKPLHEWAQKRGVAIVLSSSFESDIGLSNIASLAKRLSMDAPIGIGTYRYLTQTLARPQLLFVGPNVTIPALKVNL